jgi:hypothetical protein
MKHIKIGKDAALELEEAAAWYEMEQQGLGMRFVSAFEHALRAPERIQSSPDSSPGQCRKERRSKIDSPQISLFGNRARKGGDNRHCCFSPSFQKAGILEIAGGPITNKDKCRGTR